MRRCIFSVLLLAVIMSSRVLLLGTHNVRLNRCIVSAAATTASPISWNRRRDFGDNFASATNRPNLKPIFTHLGNRSNWFIRHLSSKKKSHSDNVKASQVETTADDLSNDNAKSTQEDWSTATSILSRCRNVNKWFTMGLRKNTAALLAAVGFVSSSVTALIADKVAFSDRFKPAIALREFLRKEGIEFELAPVLNGRLLTNILLLQRVQSAILSEGTNDGSITSHSRRSQAAFQGRTRVSIPSWEEARRYMRYATAVYGNFMMEAAELDARGRIDGRLQRISKEAISKHIDVPMEDIVILDVDYGGDARHLRHLVAVDHVNKKVVLSIRGTFSISELVVDVAAFTREFCGGEGHSEMATMAENVWETAGPTVADLLKQNRGYELILTGHSLGAGAACLLNILLTQSRFNRPKGMDETIDAVQSRDIRCFAYASPPVFYPLEVVPRAVQSTTNYINQDDFVPFLSVHTVRHFFSCIRILDEFYNGSQASPEKTRNGSLDRLRVLWGKQQPPEILVEQIKRASNEPLAPKRGAPLLAIPAATSVWMRHDDEANYSFELCDPTSLSRLGINVDNNMLPDHSPARYEHAFEVLVRDELEKVK